MNADALHPRVAQALADAAVPHHVHRHAAMDRPIRSPADFAAALGCDLSRIAKTLFVRSPPGDRHALMVCPIARKARLPLVAAELGAARVELAPPAELAARLAYPPNGVSPVGAGEIPVFLDAALLLFPSIFIGGGVAGVEIELAPADLCRVTHAKILPLTA